MKSQHYDAILSGQPDIDFFEIHAENYMADGGPTLSALEQIRRDYPLSIHGVGLSLGGIDPLDEAHLARLAKLVERYDPFLVSEHVAWTTHDGVYYADLLPVAYTRRNLAAMVERVDRVQNALGRAILLENPSSYLMLPAAEMDEIDFLTELAIRSGCGLLLDLTNVHVSNYNSCSEAGAYLARFPMEFVNEIHVAGHTADSDTQGMFLIDTHEGTPCPEVRAVLPEVLENCAKVPVLLEWDTNIPSWTTLADAARDLKDQCLIEETIHVAAN